MTETGEDRERVRAAAVAAVAAAALAITLVGELRGLAARDLQPVTDLGAALLGVCLVMLPTVLGPRQQSIAGLGAAALTAGLIAAVLPVIWGAPPAPAATLVSGTAMVASMTLVVGSLARLLAPVTRDSVTAVAWVLAASLVLAAAPVWLAAPLDQGWPIADALVALNPLTALALPSETDYLRSDWLYRHSPLGGLRYDYPSAPALIAAYLAVSGAALILPWARRIGRTGTNSTMPPTTLEEFAR